VATLAPPYGAAQKAEGRNAATQPHQPDEI
jgi:hypothetical protein